MKTTKQKDEQTQEKTSSVLELNIHSGVISGSVFSKEVETKEWGKKKLFSFTIARGYKDEEDKWKNTNSFRKADIASVTAILHRISEFLLINEDEEQE